MHYECELKQLDFTPFLKDFSKLSFDLQKVAKVLLCSCKACLFDVNLLHSCYSLVRKKLTLVWADSRAGLDATALLLLFCFGSRIPPRVSCCHPSSVCLNLLWFVTVSQPMPGLLASISGLRRCLLCTRFYEGQLLVLSFFCSLTLSCHLSSVPLPFTCHMHHPGFFLVFSSSQSKGVYF